MTLKLLRSLGLTLGVGVLTTMFGEHLTLPEGPAVRLSTNTFFELYFVPDRTAKP